MRPRSLKSIGRIAAGACLLSAIAGAAASESLGDALVSAYKTSNLLEQNQALLRAADEDVAQSVSALRPVVNFIAESQYIDTVLINGTDNRLRLDLDWMIYDFGRTGLGIELAKQSVLATRQALRGIEQDVLLSAVRAYMDVRRAVQDVEINRTSQNVIAEELKAAQDRFAVGQITRTDVAQAEARLAAARAAVAAAEGNLEVARAAYRAAIGRATDGQTSLPAAPSLPRSLDEALSIAQRLHPVIQQAQFQAAAADIQIELARAERRPNLGVNLRLDDGEGDNNTVISTLQLRQPLFTGGRLLSSERQAIANRDAARAALLQTSVAVAEQVANAWSTIDVAGAQLRAIDLQIEAAQAAYDGTREEATLGARTTLDVLDAERELLSARSDRIAAEANQQIAFYSLLSAMGLLTAENLKLGIPVYDPEAYYNAVRNAPLSPQGAALDRILGVTDQD